MKNLVAVSAIALLVGCASQGKGDKQIYMEAAKAYRSTLQSEQKNVNFTSVKIPSHGLIADGLVIAAKGGANAVQLRRELLKAQSSGDTGFLIIGSSGSLDMAVINGAFESQDFSGMKIYYSGGMDKKDQIRAAIEGSNASFHYLSPR